MPLASRGEINGIIDRFIPESLRSNVLIRAMLAGAAAIAILLAVPIWAPIGVVGATGWIVVYFVVGGTLSADIVRFAWARWRDMSADERAALDAKLELLKKAREDGIISEEEYKSRARAIIESILGPQEPV